MPSGGYAYGVVARKHKNVILAYFFGPITRNVPSIQSIVKSRADQAALVGKTGDLGLKKGHWPLLGSSSPWLRHEWPIPAFVRYEELTGRSYRVTYSDDNPNAVPSEILIEPGAAEQGPPDGLMGYGYAEIVLEKILLSNT